MWALKLWSAMPHTCKTAVPLLRDYVLPRPSHLHSTMVEHRSYLNADCASAACKAHPVQSSLCRPINGATAGAVPGAEHYSAPARLTYSTMV